MAESGERPFLNGMCYVYSYTRGSVPPETAADLMAALNVKSVRSWSHITWLLKDPYTVNRAECDAYHRMYALLKDAGVEQIVGMSHTWFLPEECPDDVSPFSVPARDMSEGSVYRRFLQMYEASWRTLAEEFPEINYWETGNEHNHDPFLHPLDYGWDTDKNVYTHKEKADIATDMMLCAARGIRSANPEAFIIMPGMAPIGEHGLGVIQDNVRVDYEGMAKTLDIIYSNIESGEFGSTDPRDYFDALAWHPYFAVQQPDGSWVWQVPDDRWVELNKLVYSVAEKHGDSGIGCYFTEFGFNDFGDANIDESLCEHVLAGMRMVREKLPFVQSVHAYRMFEHLDTQDSIDNYAYFHADNGNVYPKQRAYALQRAYGGNRPLRKG